MDAFLKSAGGRVGKYSGTAGTQESSLSSGNQHLVHVALVALLLLHSREIFGCALQGAVRALGDDVQQRHFDVLGHAGGVAADVEVGPLLQPCEELFGVLLHTVLDVDLFALVARERRVQAGEEAVALHPEELLLVEIVGDGALFAEEEPVVAFVAVDLAVFEERAEGSDARAGTDHDDRSVGVFGQAEGVVLVEEDGHGRANRRAFAEEARADALALGPVGLVADDADHGMDLAGVRVERGGDGVHARREALQDVEELPRLGNDAGKIGDKVDELAAPDVLLGQRLVFGTQQGFQSWWRVVGAELGELVDAAAGKFADAEARTQGFFERNFYLVVVQDALGAGEAQRL